MHRACSAILALVLAHGSTAIADSGCQGRVYLTLDTGNMAQAELIAHTLNETGVKATFFIANEKTFRGDFALDAGWGEYWRMRVREGHSFGNHTWHHDYLRRDIDARQLLAVSGAGRERRLDRRAFCGELAQVNNAFASLTGTKLAGLWRAPGGRTTQNAVLWAASCGFPMHIGWSEAGFLGDELDSEKFPNDKLRARAEREIRDGDVLMMHLGVWSRRTPFAPMLKPLIAQLKARGLCFATLGAANR